MTVLTLLTSVNSIFNVRIMYLENQATLWQLPSFEIFLESVTCSQKKLTFKIWKMLRTLFIKLYHEVNLTRTSFVSSLPLIRNSTFAIYPVLVSIFFPLFSGLVVTEDNFKVIVGETSEAEVVAVVVVDLFQKLEVTRDRSIFEVVFNTKLCIHANRRFKILIYDWGW